METAIENPVLKDTDTSELKSQLRDTAEKADAAGFRVGSDEPSAQETTPRTVETEVKQPVSSPDTKPDKPERPRDELGRFTTREDGTDIPEAERKPATVDKPDVATPDASKPTEPKPESEYARKQKEAERRDRSWQALEAEKLQARAEIEAARRQLEAERQKLTQQPKNGQQQPKIAAKEFAEFAKKQRERAAQLRAAGDYDEADKAADLAVDAAAKALEASEQESTQQHEQVAQQSQQAWIWDMQQAQQREPEAHKEGSPIRKEVEFLLGNFGPVFERIPPTKMADGSVMGGFSLATEVAKLRLQAGLASGLEEENKKLKAENARLNGNLSLNGSGPSGGPLPQKKFEEMTIEEMKRNLRQNAERAGNLRVA